MGAGGAVAVVGGRVGGREGLLDLLVVPVGLLCALVDVVGQGAAEGLLGVGDLDPVLRALGAGDRRDDRGQVQLEPLGVARLGGRVVPEALLLGVRLDQRELLVGTAGQLEVLDRLLVDREDRDGRAELGAHVADRGAVGQRQRGDAGAVELDELADHAVLAQHLGDGQHQVGGRGALGQVAGELEADHARDEHGDRLAQHGRLGLDAADAPADHADAVDHRGVGVGADAGVGVGLEHAVDLTGEDGAREVLDVDLVHDAGARRDDLEVVEGALAPPQELVALAVALVLDLDVALEGLRGAEDVGDHRVVDDHLGGRERVDLGGVAAQLSHRLAHRRQVDHARHAGEVLHDHAGGRELDLLVRVGVGVPAREGLDVVGGDVGTVLGAQEVLQQHLEAERKRVDVEPLALDRAESEDLVGLAVHVQGALGTEAVLTDHQSHLLPGIEVVTASHLAAALPMRGSKADLTRRGGSSSNMSRHQDTRHPVTFRARRGPRHERGPLPALSRADAALPSPDPERQPRLQTTRPGHQDLRGVPLRRLGLRLLPGLRGRSAGLDLDRGPDLEGHRDLA